jgi:ribosomal protein S18 acetylase RimI-like enzyme
MKNHPLDNPIWNALTTRQEKFAEIAGSARRFPPAITTLAAFLQPARESYESLATLVQPGEEAVLFPCSLPDVAPGLSVDEIAPLLQMVHEGEEANALVQFEELDDADVQEMLTLADLTLPGPFSTRTRELGNYIGIRREGRLVAMAGERLQLPGYTEISAVCTHPEHAGHGYASALVAELVKQIRGRGEVPFLHVRPQNTRAVELYGRLGFTPRVTFSMSVLRRA